MWPRASCVMFQPALKHRHRDAVRFIGIAQNQIAPEQLQQRAARDLLIQFCPRRQLLARDARVGKQDTQARALLLIGTLPEMREMRIPLVEYAISGLPDIFERRDLLPLHIQQRDQC